MKTSNKKQAGPKEQFLKDLSDDPEFLAHKQKGLLTGLGVARADRDFFRRKRVI